MSYNAFVTYAVLLALLHLPRPELKQRVVDSPDILSVIDQIPHLGSLLNSFYEGRYKELFTSIGARDRASVVCAASPSHLSSRPSPPPPDAAPGPVPVGAQSVLRARAARGCIHAVPGGIPEVRPPLVA